MAKPNETRDRLLQAAADLIWTSSYHATGVERICEVAKVNKGSFYHHFASKEELAIAALEEQWTHVKPRVDEVFSPANKPLERLANWARMTVEMQLEKQRLTGCVCGCPLYALGSEMGSQAPALQKAVQALIDVKLRYLVSAVREAHAAGDIVAPDAERTAQLLMDISEGVLMRARIANDTAPLATLEPTFFAVLGIPSPAQVGA